MIIETKFSNGDKVFSRKTDNKTGVVSCNGPLTVGMVRVVSVKSPGVRGMEIFASYQAYTKYFEEYMCVETGIYSGTVYNDVELFASMEEAVQCKL